MFARDRIDDKNWDCYDEEVDKGRCKCGQGKMRLREIFCKSLL
ncbi:hypothetical protein CLHUN_42500 [Ruminiclostridium hungatei]|uniref:Uncharacterized protein n=1 Tax=Ruminiclostridium hungatei TaxID=48256 RepID=A0A1V4SEK3_RUMHU|nr:hypothetical protein CLHUN_42500 [Ruminiclostridium hungatei]